MSVDDDYADEFDDMWLPQFLQRDDSGIDSDPETALRNMTENEILEIEENTRMYAHIIKLDIPPRNQQPQPEDKPQPRCPVAGSAMRDDDNQSVGCSSPYLFEVELTASDEDDEDTSLFELMLPSASFRRLPGKPTSAVKDLGLFFFCSIFCCFKRRN